MPLAPVASVGDLTCRLDGETALPPGYLAALVSHLQMTELPAPRPDYPAAGLQLRPVPEPEPDWYRQLFIKVGGDWLWFSRLLLDEADLRQRIRAPGTQIHVLTQDGAEIGLLELARHGEEIELAYFGLAAPAIGAGAGRFLMNRALQLAWAERPDRVTVHTCSLDHPAALAFYLRSGFHLVRRGIEIFRDPRLLGVLPLTAAPQIPLAADAASGAGVQD